MSCCLKDDSFFCVRMIAVMDHEEETRKKKGTFTSCGQFI